MKRGRGVGGGGRGACSTQADSAGSVILVVLQVKR